MSQGALQVLTTPTENFATSTTGVIYTDGKFATGVNDSGGRFSASVNDTEGKLSSVSMTLAAIFPLVSPTPVANYGNNIRLLTP
jgi:hypothetical protein